MSNVCIDCEFQITQCVRCGQDRAPEDLDKQGVCRWCRLKEAKEKYGT